MKNTRIIKVIYAILLFLCLVPTMLYGYFQLIRFLGLMLFGYLAYVSFRAGNERNAFIYLGLAILFQPFIKIALGRVIWNIVDVIVGVWLLVQKNDK